MKRVLVAAVSMGLLGTMAMSVTAFAGKEERDFMKTEVAPAVKEAQAKFKSACGCTVVMTVDEANLKSTSDMREVKHMAESVTEGAPQHCTDDASRKAMCQMKTLVFAKAAEATFTFKAGKGTATTDGQSSCSWEMMTQELDK